MDIPWNPDFLLVFSKCVFFPRWSDLGQNGGLNDATIKVQYNKIISFRYKCSYYICLIISLLHLICFSLLKYHISCRSLYAVILYYKLKKVHFQSVLFFCQMCLPFGVLQTNWIFIVSTIFLCYCWYVSYLVNLFGFTVPLL